MNKTKQYLKKTDQTFQKPINIKTGKTSEESHIDKIIERAY